MDSIDFDQLSAFLSQLAKEADAIDATPVSHADAAEFFLLAVRGNLLTEADGRIASGIPSAEAAPRFS